MAELKVHMHLDSSELQFVLYSISKLNIPVDMAPEVHRQSEKITSFCEFKTCQNSLIGISSCFFSIVPSEQFLDFFRWLKFLSETAEAELSRRERISKAEEAAIRATEMFKFLDSTGKD